MNEIDQLKSMLAQLRARVDKLEGKETKIEILTEQQFLHRFSLSQNWDFLVSQANSRRTSIAEVAIDRVRLQHPEIAGIEAIDGNKFKLESYV